MKFLKILANENFPWKAVKALRTFGHDIVWVTKDRPGSSDREVLAWAIREKRILLTFDHDFSQLAFRIGLPMDIGIILFAIPLDSPDEVAKRAVHILGNRHDWSGHFSIVEERQIRMVSLQKA